MAGLDKNTLSWVQGGVRGFLLAVLPLLLSSPWASGQGVEQAGAIVFLPCWPDPVTDVLFNMQVHLLPSSASPNPLISWKF